MVISASRCGIVRCRGCRAAGFSRSGERGVHNREVGCRDKRRALPRIDIDRTSWVAVAGAGAVAQPADGPIMEVRRLLRLVDLVAERDGSSGETALHVQDLAPACLGAVTRHQAHRADGGGVYERGQRLPAVQLKPHHRVEWQTGRAGADFLTNRLRSDGSITKASGTPWRSIRWGRRSRYRLP